MPRHLVISGSRQSPHRVRQEKSELTNRIVALSSPLNGKKIGWKEVTQPEIQTILQISWIEGSTESVVLFRDQKWGVVIQLQNAINNTLSMEKSIWLSLLRCQGSSLTGIRYAQCFLPVHRQGMISCEAPWHRQSHRALHYQSKWCRSCTSSLPPDVVRVTELDGVRRCHRLYETCVVLTRTQSPNIVPKSFKRRRWLGQVLLSFFYLTKAWVPNVSKNWWR